MTYQPDFDADFRRGKVGENLVGSFLKALEGGTIEVKTDYGLHKTGNLYIETWQYRNPDMSDKKQSGINITKADYWCFASPEGKGFLMVETETLKKVIRETNPREAKQPITSEKTMGSIGRLVKVKDLLNAMKLIGEEPSA